MLFIPFTLAAPVVTLGTDLVVMPDGRQADVQDVNGTTAPPSNAWVPVVADCLDEAGPDSHTLVDLPLDPRNQVVDILAKLKADPPGAVVVGIGAMSAKQLDELVVGLQTIPVPRTFVVGPVAPTLTQVPEKAASKKLRREQASLDESVDAANAALQKLASVDDGIWHVDLWSRWPKDLTERAALTSSGHRLTDAAHARVGAVICEEIIANLFNRKK